MRNLNFSPRFGTNNLYATEKGSRTLVSLSKKMLPPAPSTSQRCYSMKWDNICSSHMFYFQKIFTNIRNYNIHQWSENPVTCNSRFQTASKYVSGNKHSQGNIVNPWILNSPHKPLMVKTNTDNLVMKTYYIAIHI